MILTRLKDFSKNQFAEMLHHYLLENYSKMTEELVFNLDVLSKGKKVQDMDRYTSEIRNTFDFHFYINSKTVDNPYFKADALVWSCIYHSKVPRYSDKVYKMAEYLIQTF